MFDATLNFFGCHHEFFDRPPQFLSACTDVIFANILKLGCCQDLAEKMVFIKDSMQYMNNMKKSYKVTLSNRLINTYANNCIYNNTTSRREACEANIKKGYVQIQGKIIFKGR